MHSTLNRQLPTLFVPEFIAPAGKRAHELMPFEIGLMDCETGLTVDRATYGPDRMYELVFKTPSKGQPNAMFPDPFGTQLPIRSLPISFIDKTHVFDRATSEQKPFVAYLGYDGLSDCKNIELPCGITMGLLVHVRGETVRNTFNRNLSQIIPFRLPCCDDCASDISGNLTVDTIIDAIESAPFYANHYFKAEKVMSCCPAEGPFSKKFYHTFKLDVCDNGDSRALAKVQSNYPGMKVERVSRVDSTSTYEVCIPLAFTGETISNIEGALDAYNADPTQANLDTYNQIVDAAIQSEIPNTLPAPLVMSNVKQLVCDECPDCPSTFTVVPETDKYIVCFNSPAAAGVGTFEEFKESYYSDPMVAPDTIEGLVQAAGAMVTGFVADSAELLGEDCDKVTIQVCVDKGTDLTEHGLADVSVTHIGVCEGYCEGEATVDWCPGEVKYKISRVMCMTLKDPDCGGDFLEDVINAVKDREDVIADSISVVKSNGCITEYTLEQCNNKCLEDGCDTFGKDGAKFDDLPAVKHGLWAACKCEGWTFDDDGCPVPPEAELQSCRAGIKFTGAFIDREILECTWAIDDKVDREPIEIEVSVIKDVNDVDNGDVCHTLEIPWTVVQQGSYAEGRGEYLARKEVTGREYELYRYFNPKRELGNLLQHRLGYEYLVDPTKFYNCISLYHNSNRNRYANHHPTGATREIIMLAVDKDNVTLFNRLKDWLNGTLLSMGHMRLL